MLEKMKCKEFSLNEDNVHTNSESVQCIYSLQYMSV